MLPKRSWLVSGTRVPAFPAYELFRLLLALAQRQNSASSICCSSALPWARFNENCAAHVRGKICSVAPEAERLPGPAPLSGDLRTLRSRRVRRNPMHVVEEDVKRFHIAQTMSPSTVRVLVVEDYKPYRRFVRLVLRKRPTLEIVGEASDGVEAVRRAEELKPDLILLDIGLPSLNGIEAARQIRSVAPESKIVFLSHESSADVVREALSLGAWGYVVKATAETDLLAAIDAVLLGRHFVSGTSAT